MPGSARKRSRQRGALIDEDSSRGHTGGEVPEQPRPTTVHLKNLRQRGFSTVELIVTVVALVALAGVLIPSMNTYLNESQRVEAHDQMDQIAQAFTKYKADTLDWPTPYDKLPIKTGNHSFSSYYGFYRNTTKNAGWDGPYLNDGVVVAGHKRVSDFSKGAYDGLVDPWGRQFRVFTYAHGYSGTTGGLMLVSYGLDGMLNTSAEDIFAGDARGDDLVQLITYSLN